MTLTGANLTGTTGVTFGGTAATSVTVVSATSVTCVTPAKAAGAVSVVVTTSGGNATLTNGYTYVASALPVTAGLALWVDASQLTGMTNGQQVNTWTDMSGQANHAVRQSGSSTGYPMLVSSVLNGKPVVRFNSATSNTGDYFKFNRISTIRTVFWVLKENAGLSDGCFLLGDESFYDFHRDGANGAIWNDPYAHASIRGGTTRLMGTVVNGTTTALPAGQFQLLSLVTTGNVQANQICQDRIYHGSWQGDIAEIIIYTTALSASDETLVSNYLNTKYGLSTNVAPTITTPKSGV